jgi:hypothetical protein
VSEIRDRYIPLVFTFIVGIIIILNFVNNQIPIISTAANGLVQWAILLSTIALGVGLLNLLIIHFRNVVRRTPDIWYFSLWLIIITVATLIIGLGYGVDTKLYSTWFDNLFMYPYNTIVTYLGIVTFSSGYRFVRAKNIESLLLLLGTVFVMMWYAPIGEIIWSGIPIIGHWMYYVAGVGTQRAFLIGVGIGAISVGIKTLLGLERGWLGRRREE